MYCYIHIPFCNNRCKYCRFTSFSNTQENEKTKYVDFLIENIKNDSLTFEKEKINKKEQFNKFDSIYFGGGTPTSLHNYQLENIILALKTRYGFTKNIEITLESTLNNVSPENLKIWNELGINRLSLGIQTLKSKSLKEIGRLTRKEIIQKLNIIKKYLETNQEITKNKIQNFSISLDFIIGLPFVKPLETKKDIKFILDKYNFVKHISIYMLEEYYDYPKTWKDVSLKENEFEKEYISCKKLLEKYGFFRYELSNFSKKGYECKHNKAYWNHKEVIAYGLGSHGFVNQTRYAYPNNFKDFYENKFDYIEKLNKNDIFLEKVIFGLRTSGLKQDIYKKLNQQKIKYFIKNKLLDFNNYKLILSDKGATLIDYIIKEII
ncbi:MAG: coproporphyrinogen-III oxidase family protein [Candidatus Gracilibacteria bacterium]|nr:coproporphyrinogen-III oxidase family protein [Candidatus Gracilibacteria bacterium]